MKSLSVLVKEVKHDMDVACIPYDNSVPVVQNNRMRSTGGKCKYRKDMYGKYYAFIVEINGKMLANESEDFLKNVICHELIHSACLGDGHKKRWAKYANLMNQRNTNYHIERCYHRSDVTHSYRAKSEYKYKIVCSKCGKTYYYKRKGKAVSRIKNGYCGYSCGRCGSHSLVVENI